MKEVYEVWGCAGAYTGFYAWKVREFDSRPEAEELIRKLNLQVDKFHNALKQAYEVWCYMDNWISDTMDIESDEFDYWTNKKYDALNGVTRAIFAMVDLSPCPKFGPDCLSDKYYPDYYTLQDLGRYDLRQKGKSLRHGT